MIHSGLLDWLDISTFYFYEPLLFEKTQNGLWYISNGLKKKLYIEKNRFFSADYVKINELYVVNTWRHTQSE